MMFQISSLLLQDPGTQFCCTLTIQGFHFTGRNTSKKRARNEAVRLAFVAFEASPPPVVNVTVKGAKRGLFSNDLS